MTKPIKRDAVIERLVDLLDVWERPVCSADLVAADPTTTKHCFANALKWLAEAEILYVHSTLKKRTYYAPMRMRPVCLIQELICKGFRGFGLQHQRGGCE